MTADRTADEKRTITDAMVIGCVWLLVTLAPLHVITMAYVRSFGEWDRVNHVFLGNACLAGILFLLLLISLPLKKPYLAIFFGCHQKPSRSFFFFSQPAGLCARCTGMFVGVFLTLLLPFFSALYLVGAGPLIVDGTLQATTRYESGPRRRFMTGLVFAPAFVWLYSTFSWLLVRGAFAIVNAVIA